MVLFIVVVFVRTVRPLLVLSQTTNVRLFFLLVTHAEPMLNSNKGKAEFSKLRINRSGIGEEGVFKEQMFNLALQPLFCQYHLNGCPVVVAV